jgi:hypothetical protein
MLITKSDSGSMCWQVIAVHKQGGLQGAEQSVGVHVRTEATVRRTTIQRSFQHPTCFEVPLGEVWAGVQLWKLESPMTGVPALGLFLSDCLFGWRAREPQESRNDRALCGLSELDASPTPGGSNPAVANHEVITDQGVHHCHARVQAHGREEPVALAGWSRWANQVT